MKRTCFICGARDSSLLTEWDDRMVPACSVCVAEVPDPEVEDDEEAIGRFGADVQFSGFDREAAALAARKRHGTLDGKLPPGRARVLDSFVRLWKRLGRSPAIVEIVADLGVSRKPMDQCLSDLSKKDGALTRLGRGVYELVMDSPHVVERLAKEAA